MAGLCKITIVGNLGRDPEKRYTQDGRAMTRFSVAATTRRKGREGDWEDHTEWFNVTVFGQRGETLADRLSKGSRVYLEGRLESRTYEGANGRGFAMDVIANEVISLDSRQRGEADFGGHADASEDVQPAGDRGRLRSGRPAPTEDASDLEDLPF
jgi:single-strand DNA-binding protein